MSLWVIRQKSSGTYLQDNAGWGDLQTAYTYPDRAMAEEEVHADTEEILPVRLTVIETAPDA